MAASEDTIRGLQDAAERLEKATRNLAGNSGNQSTITLNAGGIGVWIACTCCAVMLACNVFLVGLYLDQQRQISSLNDYLSAIYVQAPALQRWVTEDQARRAKEP